MMSDRSARMALEKLSRLTRSIIIKLPITVSSWQIKNDALKFSLVPVQRKFLLAIFYYDAPGQTGFFSHESFRVLLFEIITPSVYITHIASNSLVYQKLFLRFL